MFCGVVCKKSAEKHWESIYRCGPCLASGSTKEVKYPTLLALRCEAAQRPSKAAQSQRLAPAAGVTLPCQHHLQLPRVQPLVPCLLQVVSRWGAVPYSQSRPAWAWPCLRCCAQAQCCSERAGVLARGAAGCGGCCCGQQAAEGW